MPVEGPITRRVQRGVAHNVEAQVANQAVKGAKTLASVLPDVDVDEARVRAGVHELLDDVWSGLGLDANSAAKDSAALGALKDAAKSFVQPELAPSERRALLAKAAGDPLTDAVLEVVVDLASLLPAGALAKGADWASQQVAGDGVQNALETKWYAPFVPTAGGFSSIGGDLEKLRARMKEPGFRSELGRALDVVRVLGRLEAHNLEQIALDVDKAGSPAVKAAFARFSSDVAEDIALSSIPRDTKESALVRDLVLLAAIRTRSLGGIARENDARDFADIVARLSDAGDHAANVVVDATANALDGKPITIKAEALLDAAEALRENDANTVLLPKRLDDARDRLLADLESAGALSDEAKSGINEMCADFSAVVVTSAHLFRLFGAAKNDKIPEGERIDLVKNAAKDAGPIVVKLLQTFANQAKADGGGPIDDVTHRALVELQEHVPEMSDAEVRAQVEAGLGKKLEDAFVSFDMKPLASASIGQVHRAQIKGRFGKVRDVVVKVQRPGLDDEFARATRVARLGLQFAGELVRVLNDQGKMPKELADKGIDPARMMKLVEETVTSFVESFQIETDFDKERVNLKKFRRDMRAHNHVTAPYVYRQWSSKTVMTMELMRLEKISSLIDRAHIARETKKTQAPVGPLPTNVTADELDAELKKRAVDHIARAFGIVVDDASDKNALSIEHDKKLGYVITASTDHPLYPRVRIAISDKTDRRSGVIKHVEAPPILKDEEVRKVRDRFLASLLSQVIVHGRVHGDPHKGNWGLLADGQTIVMLDFGKMIDVKKKHLMAPIALAWNWFRKDADGMADAVLTMTTAPDGKKNAAKKDIATSLSDLMTKSGGRAQPDEIVATVTATLAQAGLGLSPVYTQSIKAGFSFAGNFGGLSEVGAGDIDLSSLARAGRITALDVADTASLGVVGGVLSMRKNARVSALNQAPKL